MVDIYHKIEGEFMSRQAYIRAIDMYLPENIEKNDLGDRLISKIGIKERRIIGEDESISDMGMKVAKSLLAKHHIRVDEIDFLVLCTQQPEYFMPTTACILHEKLGLPKKCGALDYNLGCSGYVYGLSIVKGLIESGMASNVLLITSCAYTRYINKEDLTTRPLFGDSATATLISATESEKPYLHSFSFGTDGSKFESLIIPAGADKNPPFKTPVVEEVDERGNKRTNYEVFMDGQEVMHFTLREVPALVEDVITKANLERKDIDYYIFHQANKVILEYVQKKCKLQGMPFFNECEKEGNTVSSTIPIGLVHVLEKNEARSLKNVMLAGFGVGLSWAGCIADLSKIDD